MYLMRDCDTAKVIDVDLAAGSSAIVIRYANGAIGSRYADGRVSADDDSPGDLMPPKRVVWANFYSIGIGHYFDTEDEARGASSIGASRVAVRVELP